MSYRDPDAKPVIVRTLNLEGRRMFQIGNHCIPVDRIREIQFDGPNGGCNNSVRIITDDPNDDHIWAYENADAIKTFLGHQPAAPTHWSQPTLAKCPDCGASLRVVDGQVVFVEHAR